MIPDLWLLDLFCPKKKIPHSTLHSTLIDRVSIQLATVSKLLDKYNFQSRVYITEFLGQGFQSLSFNYRISKYIFRTRFSLRICIKKIKCPLHNSLTGFPKQGVQSRVYKAGCTKQGVQRRISRSPFSLRDSQNTQNSSCFLKSSQQQFL